MATTEQDLYKLLGVERGASDAEIKRAFRKLAQQWHPGRQQGPGGRGPIQGGQRGLPDPVGPRATPALRHVRAGRRRRRCRRPGRRLRGVRRFQRHLRCLLRRRGGRWLRAARPTAARGGPPLRPAHHLRGSRQGHREGDRLPRPRPLRDLLRQRRQARHRGDDLPAVRGPRRGPQRPPDHARPDGQRQRLPALPRRGQDRRDAVRDVQGRRPDRAQAEPPRDDPRRHRRGPPDPAHERGRGRCLAAARPGRSTSRSTSARTRRSSATAPSCTTRPGCRSPRRRSARASSSRPWTATRRSRSSPEPSPTRRSACAARACPTSGGAAPAATSTSWSMSSSRRSSARSSASRSRRTRKDAGETVGGGGIREKLGL